MIVYSESPQTKMHNFYRTNTFLTFSQILIFLSVHSYPYSIIYIFFLRKDAQQE